MHGVIPPEPGASGGEVLAAVAKGWSGYAESRTSYRRTTATRRPVPLPAPLLSAAQLALDGSVAAVSALLARHLVGHDSASVGALLVGTAGTLMVAMLAGAYRHTALFGGRSAMRAVAFGLGAAVLGLALAAPLLGAPEALTPQTAGLWVLFGLPLLVVTRLATGRLARAETQRTAIRAVVVGEGRQAARLAAALRGPGPVRLLGVVHDRRRLPEGLYPDTGLPQLGSLDALGAMIRRGEVDRVILALPWSCEARARALLHRLSDYPVEVCLAPDLLSYSLSRQPQMPLQQMPLVQARPIAGWAAAVKRAEDIVLALGALAVAAVPMLLIALAIRLDSPGPVLFRQRRTGYNNCDFFVLKFRTMYTEATDHEARVQVVDGDPRVTPVGAILRRTSLDELPQLLNVLRGEMSFVGPRPHAPGTLAGGRPFDQVAERYAARHRVKPGLTGLAQVRGWRGPTETEEKLIRRVESDLEYIDKWSLWLDVTIIFRTLVAVARMRNAC